MRPGEERPAAPWSRRGPRTDASATVRRQGRERRRDIAVAASTTMTPARLGIAITDVLTLRRPLPNVPWYCLPLGSSTVDGSP
jgi:hypothetical protein